MKRVRRPHGLLNKAPQIGDEITVVQDGYVRSARVRKLKFVRLEWRTNTPKIDRRQGDVRRQDEGITWARGWDTPEANALRTSVALS